MSFCLFANKSGAAVPFESQTNLNDWQFPARVSGIVLLIDAYENAGLARQFRERLKSGDNRTFAWVGRQALPVAVGAIGAGLDDHAAARLRRRYRLPPEVPILTGRPPARSHSNAGSEATSAAGRLRASLTTVVGMGEITFDREFAVRILALLAAQIHKQEARVSD